MTSFIEVEINKEKFAGTSFREVQLKLVESLTIDA